jgi:hypothetical protein
MIRLLLLTICLVSANASAAEVFRWVDDDGQINYSDRPHEGAEAIDLQAAQTFSAPTIERSQSKVDAPEEEEASKYSRLRITNPADGQADWDIPGNVNVTLSLRPKLQRQHSVTLYMDGQSVGSSSSEDLTFNLTGVLRGTHTLRAAVQNSAGKDLIDSSTVSFTVHKTSILNPNNPNNFSPPVPTPFSAGGGP